MIHKRLYLICPTDDLEFIIKKRFRGAPYFYTSLGNLISLDERTLGQIAQLVERNSIKEITFVLSTDNNILLDALNDQCFIKIKGLNRGYSDFIECKTQIAEVWKTYRQKDLIFSYYLNQKIKALKKGLSEFLLNVPDINGRLYSKSNDRLRLLPSSIIFLSSCRLN